MYSFCLISCMYCCSHHCYLTVILVCMNASKYKVLVILHFILALSLTHYTWAKTVVGNWRHNDVYWCIHAALWNQWRCSLPWSRNHIIDILVIVNTPKTKPKKWDDFKYPDDRRGFDRVAWSCLLWSWTLARSSPFLSCATCGGDLRCRHAWQFDLVVKQIKLWYSFLSCTRTENIRLPRVLVRNFNMASSILFWL